ncbi:glycosyltransferase [Haloarchaeobius sp. DFWS5]|uniref:glycosyltransferase n=1 Tax=Haloarchaeobius sp. DFWS5 TaxID=3446114 RepID=UPI003EBDD466
MNVLSLTSNPKSTFYTHQVHALREQGVDVTTVSVPGNQFATQSNPETRSVVDYVRFLPMVVRESLNDFDVVHANYGLTAPAALAQFRLPVVLTLWGSDLMGKYGWLGKVAARQCDEVIVMSERMAAQLQGDAHVIPHGVDLDRFQPVPPETARERVGWDPETRHVFFPYSTRRPVKNYPLAERVVEAVDELADWPVTLQTVTDVPHEEMFYYYNAADALLLTSSYEGSPNSVKEAMACNTPVVSTDVGDVPELLDGVEQSALCDSEAALVTQLFRILEARQRSTGRAGVSDRDLASMGSQIRSVYAAALSS